MASALKLLTGNSLPATCWTADISYHEEPETTRHGNAKM